MRAPTFVIAFVALLLLGFLPTPGISKFAVPDYLIALRQYSEPIRLIKKRISDAELRISELESKAARLTKDSALAPDTAKKIDLAAQATIATFDRNAQFELKAKDVKLLAEDEKKLEAAAADGTNLSLVLRALGLGAIGALMSILAQYLAPDKAQVRRTLDAGSARMWASMAMGAIVAVVAIGLLYTGFISIFSHAEASTGTPDFWKVTILALLAGAFADRLFQAAAYRVDRYVGQVGTDPNAHGEQTRRPHEPGLTSP